MLQALEDNGERFAYCMEDIEPFKGEPMEINLNTYKPIFRPPHKLGQVEWDFVRAQCEKLAALGFIQRSTQSNYASAIVVVRKDEHGNYTDFRQCGDYRPLNMETTLDRYPLPGIEDIFNQMGVSCHEVAIVTTELNTMYTTQSQQKCLLIHINNHVNTRV